MEPGIRQTAEWPTWNILPDSDPALAVVAELIFDGLCTYPAVITAIPYSLVCHMCQKVSLKSSTIAFAASFLFTRHATVTKEEIRLI